MKLYCVYSQKWDTGHYPELGTLKVDPYKNLVWSIEPHRCTITTSKEEAEDLCKVAKDFGGFSDAVVREIKVEVI